MRQALGNLELPQTITTLNNNTQKIEVGLVEEVYTDRENTDQTLQLKSKAVAPFVISIGIIRSNFGDESFSILLDPDQTELNCVD